MTSGLEKCRREQRLSPVYQSMDTHLYEDINTIPSTVYPPINL